MKKVEYVPASNDTDLCKDFPATEDALALALSNGFFLLLPQHIPLLILPLGENLHRRCQSLSVILTVDGRGNVVMCMAKLGAAVPSMTRLHAALVVTDARSGFPLLTRLSGSKGLPPSSNCSVRSLLEQGGKRLSKSIVWVAVNSGSPSCHGFQGG